jgi:prepilin-type N-terminal cleavage/methylation domain-containing protein
MAVDIRRPRGFTLIELLVSMAIAALLLAAMSGLVGTALETRTVAGGTEDALRDARFAMQRMVTAVRGTERLLLPLADNPATTWRENVREQTIPASAPEGNSTFASAVLAVTLDPAFDIDEDGVADADNDGDGRVDEDLGNDSTNDGAAGIIGIDDDGDGSIDEEDSASGNKDNDEDGLETEDRLDGADDDGDGSVDEDIQQDMNKDNAPGLWNVDDDGDGEVDEGNNDDDDEDGLRNEDPFDAVVFYLSGSNLVERRPNLDPVDGTDFSEYVIAENVARFRVERLPEAGRRAVLLDLTLELNSAGGDTVTVHTRVRVGGPS